MARKRIWPAAEDLRVLDAVTGQAVDPYDGAEIDDTDLYWSRLQRDGDIVDERPPWAKPAKPKPAADHAG